MAVDKFLADWKKKIFKPVYWVEGDEDYDVDRLVNYAEHHILTESEASFNLSIFYGKDSNWGEIITACRKYPMFSDKQVVIVKEAAQLKDIEKLEPYLVSPLPSTIFIVGMKGKKLDSRTRFAKIVKDKTEYAHTKKIRDNALPAWVSSYVAEAGLKISPKANVLLVEHIGNDLNRIKNELEKISINVSPGKTITEDDIETYVGINKEYNVYEFQKAIADKDFHKAINIVQYFSTVPESVSIHQILATLYLFFSKVYMLFGFNGSDEKIAGTIGVPPYFVKDYSKASFSFGHKKVEEILLLLHQYNLKSVGIQSFRAKDSELLKELVVKILM